MMEWSFNIRDQLKLSFISCVHHHAIYAKAFQMK